MSSQFRPIKVASISIIFLLLVCASVFFLIPKQVSPQYCKQVTFPDEKGGIISCDTISKSRKFTLFYLTDDSAKNYQVLQEARSKLNSIKKLKDTIHGIDIVLSEGTDYKYFILATDICSEVPPHAYAPCTNHIYALYCDTTPPPEKFKITYR